MMQMLIEFDWMNIGQAMKSYFYYFYMQSSVQNRVLNLLTVVRPIPLSKRHRAPWHGHLAKSEEIKRRPPKRSKLVLKEVLNLLVTHSWSTDMIHGHETTSPLFFFWGWGTSPFLKLNEPKLWVILQPKWVYTDLQTKGISLRHVYVYIYIY